MDKIDIEVNVPGVDKSINSVKELRQKIAELKDTLVTLDSSSQEYSDTVQELQVHTSKLNEVNSASKQTLDAIPGSYNAINNEMKALIQEYKSMAVVTDEDKKKQAELAEKISELNDELKRQDAAIGNFQRNVGNYSSAFDGLRKVMDITKTGTGQLKDGFNAINTVLYTTSGEASSTSDALTALGATFEGVTSVATSLFDSVDKVNIAYQLGSEVLTLFKTSQSAATVATEADTVAKKANTVATTAEAAATKTATVATQGLTKALLTNPFTLIAVAVLALVANLDKLINGFKALKDWWTGANEQAEHSQQVLNQLIDTNTRLLTTQDEKSKALEREIKILKAQGKSTQDIIKLRMKENEANRQAIRSQIELTKARIAELRIKAQDDPDKYDKQLKQARESLKELAKAYKKLAEQQADYRADLQVTLIEEKKNNEVKVKEAKKANEDIRKEQEKTTTALRTEYDKDLANYLKIVNEKAKAGKDILSQYENTIAYFASTLKNYDTILDNTLTKKRGEAEFKQIAIITDNIKKQRIEKAYELNNDLKKIEQDHLDSLKIDHDNNIKAILEDDKKSLKEKNRLINEEKITYQVALFDIKAATDDARLKMMGSETKGLLETIIYGNDGSQTTVVEKLDEAKNSIMRFKNAIAALSEQYSRAEISNDTFNEGLKRISEEYSNSVQTFENSINNSNIKDNKILKELLLKSIELSDEDANEIREYVKDKNDEVLGNLWKELAFIDFKHNTPTQDDNTLKDYILESLGIKDLSGIQNDVENALTVLEEQKQKIEDFINSDDFSALSVESQGKVLEELSKVNKSIEEKQKESIQNNAKEFADQLKKSYSGVVKGLGVIGDYFTAKMNLAKTRADKIKKDTKLSAKEQERLLEEQQKAYNEAFESNKKVQIAETTISTLASAMEAYKALAGIKVVGPALGAAAAAAALATGYLQIKQIKATTPESLSDGTSGADISPVTNTIDVNSLLNQDRESTNLNNDYLTELQGQVKSVTKVYVTETDITETQNKTKTQVSQSTF